MKEMQTPGRIGQNVPSGKMEKEENILKMMYQWQLSYLMELAKLEESQRSVMTVAQICGVNHSAVSKYFKICRERGILADGYQFTAKGERWLHGYQKSCVFHWKHVISKISGRGK